MPKEVIVDAGDQQLVVSWTKRDSLDPAVAVGSWRMEVQRDPDGREVTGEWVPSGPQWALDKETAEWMGRVLLRAARHVGEEVTNVTINVHAETDPAELLRQIQEQMLRLGARHNRM